MPAAEWPDPVNRGFRLNQQLYVTMQGPSELGLSGRLSDWDRTEDLARITVPTLIIGAEHDTMDPAWMRMMASRLPRGSYLHCPDGSHMAMYDDQATYYAGLLRWIETVEGGESS
jgi:proline iminopeptidase